MTPYKVGGMDMNTNIVPNEDINLVKEEMLRLAREYYEAAMIVSEKCPNVAMNTMAYSIEVYIKLLILIESGKSKKGHKLKSLLKELPEATIIKIGECIIKDSHSYQSVLNGWYDSPLNVVNRIIELYEDEYALQRYTYEPANKSSIRKRPFLDFGSLVCFAESLEKVVMLTIQGWRNGA